MGGWTDDEGNAGDLDVLVEPGQSFAGLSYDELKAGGTRTLDDLDL